MAGNFWKSSHSQQWVLEKSDLLRDRADDLKAFNSEDDYQKVMMYFINLIHQVGRNIDGRIRQHAIATACTYFRRFYARRSFKDMDPFCLAVTCLVFATKVDEFGMIGVTKTIGTLQSLLQKYPQLEKYAIQKHHVEEAEFILSEIMDCCLIIYHPYRPLNVFVQDMKAFGIAEKFVDTMYQDAWRIINDSLRTDAGLLFPPHTIALAAIMTAALFSRRDNELVDWLAYLNIDYEKVFECQQTLLAYYRLEKTYKEKDVVEELVLKKMPKPSAVKPKEKMEIGDI
ncbi:unnamed protein product [Bursaphelenchus xylophilus]|uniref:(pine wood nematode) hypothetical protein n=1 Tax=Bursaphelenchus xylophilus TaxID=6326 RepID=A0A1I7RJC4_BURXY|nr:unnamed protein product [Bursaphelenchus xylophilus]CAG9128786.1 unnamed protein product [Bursaphelenchus xylophilus]